MNLAPSENYLWPNREFRQISVFLVLPTGNFPIIPGNPKHVLHFTQEDLTTTETWQIMLSLSPITPGEFAIYSQKFPDTSVDTFLQALGLRPDYQNKLDWKDMQTFDDITLSLERFGSFNAAVLRLWNRLDGKQREQWLTLFQARNVKKNIVREIVLDLYDLDESGRRTALEASMAYSNNWMARSMAFPSEELRTIVRNLRQPTIEAARTKAKAIRNSLRPPQNVDIQWNEDLESGEVIVKARIKNEENIAEILRWLSNDEQKKQIIDLAKLI